VALLGNMTLLGIETATRTSSVALIRDQGPEAELRLAEGVQPSDHLLPLIDRLLTAQGCTLSALSAIVISTGPGSYTGLRVGLSIAQGLAMGSKIPLVAVPTLWAMASAFLGISSLIAPMVPARRGFIHWALFEVIPIMRQIHPNTVSSLEDALAVIATYGHERRCETLFAGEIDRERILESGITARFTPPKLEIPSAIFVARQGLIRFKNGEATPPETVVPVYGELFRGGEVHRGANPRLKSSSA